MTEQILLQEPQQSISSITGLFAMQSQGISYLVLQTLKRHPAPNSLCLYPTNFVAPYPKKLTERCTLWVGRG